jgi:putative PIN family toxin of toxin-antitoxin system
VIRAVLDVNVLVSAAISARGIPHQLLLLWQSHLFDVVVSEHILNQLLLKLRADRIARRYHLSTHAVRLFVEPLRTDAERIVVPPDQVLPISGDSEDDAVLATARLGRADYLVTGDEGLLVHSPYEGVSIMRPRTFLEIVSR